MTATIIDGKEFAAKVRGKVKDHVTRLVGDHGITPGLAVVLVGEDPASEVYVRSKGKATVEALDWQLFHYPHRSSAAERNLSPLGY